MRTICFDLGAVLSQPLAGHLHALAPPGYAPRRPVSNLAEVAEEEAETTRWALARGLIQPGTSYCEKFGQSRLAALSALTLPGVPVARARWFIRLQAFIFTLDDALDNLVDLRVNQDYLDYGELIELFGAFTDVLAGRPRRPGSSLAAEFPLFDAFVAVLEDVRAGALATRMEPSEFVGSMSAYFEALAWEHSAHGNRGYRPTPATYLENREQTISYLQSVESFLMIRGVALPPTLRLAHPVKLLLANASRHVVLVNDVFSLAKELACHELDNVLLLAETGDLRVAFDALLREIDALGVDIAGVAAKLRDAFPEGHAVHALVEIVLDSVNGHFAWYAASERYGPLIRRPVVAGINDYAP